MEVRPLTEADHAWLTGLSQRHSADPVVVTLGRVHDLLALPGLVAEEGGERLGALVYRPEGGECEVVFLAAEPPGRGAGTALLGAIEALGKEAGWGRLWLVTTNDNTPALRFYQRRGWDLLALHRNQVAIDRALKPQIPERGIDGIPLRHALELQRLLGGKGGG